MLYCLIESLIEIEIEIDIGVAGFFSEQMDKPMQWRNVSRD